MLRHTPDDPVSLSATKISGIFRAQWGVEPGVFYRVEVSSSLKSWLAAGSLTAQSPVAMWQDFMTPGAAVFYRIVGP